MKSNFIYQVIEQINGDTYYGVSNNIEIVKGKNKLTQNWKEKKNQIKRRLLFMIKK
jgi:hypothetical protein